mmetsp:Transcript_11091/g.41409  ORF Transcript_11091/g.41409 Transcript_11091/m.41409 type:complete len:543 (+) Transcript_11091:1282-2910(+)
MTTGTPSPPPREKLSTNSASTQLGMLDSTAYIPTPFKDDIYINLHSICIERKQKFQNKSCIYYFNRDSADRPLSMRAFAKKSLRTPFSYMRGKITTTSQHMLRSSTQSPSNPSLPKLYIGICFQKESLQVHIPNKEDSNFEYSLRHEKTLLAQDPDYQTMLQSEGFYTKLGLVQMIDRKTATDHHVPLDVIPQHGHENGAYLFSTTGLFCFSFLSNHIHFQSFTKTIGSKNCYALSFAIFEERGDEFVRVSNAVGNFRLIMTHSAAKPLYCPYSLGYCNSLKEYNNVLDFIEEQEKRHDEESADTTSGVSSRKGKRKPRPVEGASAKSSKRGGSASGSDHSTEGGSLHVSLSLQHVKESKAPQAQYTEFQQQPLYSYPPQSHSHNTSSSAPPSAVSRSSRFPHNPRSMNSAEDFAVSALVAAAEAIEHKESHTGHAHSRLSMMPRAKYDSEVESLRRDTADVAARPGGNRMSSPHLMSPSANHHSVDPKHPLPPQSSASARLPSIQEILGGSVQYGGNSAVVYPKAHDGASRQAEQSNQHQQ